MLPSRWRLTPRAAAISDHDRPPARAAPPPAASASSRGNDSPAGWKRAEYLLEEASVGTDAPAALRLHGDGWAFFEGSSASRHLRVTARWGRAWSCVNGQTSPSSQAARQRWPGRRPPPGPPSLRPLLGGSHHEAARRRPADGSPAPGRRRRACRQHSRHPGRAGSPLKPGAGSIRARWHRPV